MVMRMSEASRASGSTDPTATLDPVVLAQFREHVLARGRELYRDLPWRRTRDPYAVWVSEVMLQQTQVSRVDGRWQRWLTRFPDVMTLAVAESADVLEEWQGLGYNRRALMLWKAARMLAARDGCVPSDTKMLEALPGVGPATAAGIRAFAFDLPAVYLETNVRSVFLFELFPDCEGVSDRELLPLVEATCPVDASDSSDDPRTWYFSLLDYGAWLKRAVPNPSRRSAAHTQQSAFEGSHRQKRAELVRLLLAHRDEPAGVDIKTLSQELSDIELSAGRMPPSTEEVGDLLLELAREGFCTQDGDVWRA